MRRMLRVVLRVMRVRMRVRVGVRHGARGQRLAVGSEQLGPGRNAAGDGRDGDKGRGARGADRLEDAFLVHASAVLTLAAGSVLVAAAANLWSARRGHELATGESNRQTDDDGHTGADEDSMTNLSFSAIPAGNGSPLSGSFPGAIHARLTIVRCVARRRARVIVSIAVMVGLRKSTIVVVCGVLVMVGRVRRRTAVVVVCTSWLGWRVCSPRVRLRLQRGEVGGRLLLASGGWRVAIDGVRRRISRVAHVASASWKRGAVAAGPGVVDGRQGD